MDRLIYFENLSRPLDKEGRRIKASAGLESGQTLFIKGPSGSGKSTLLRLIARLLKADQGEVYLQGRNWYEFPPSEWRSRVHYVGQKPVLFPASVEDNLKMPFTLASLRNRTFSRNRAAHYLKEAGLTTGILEQGAQTLSGGEAARAALIRALLIEPQVLLLDEPMAYLDGDNRQKVIMLLADWCSEEEQRAIIIVSHQDDDLSLLGEGPVICLDSSLGGGGNG